MSKIIPLQRVTDRTRTTTDWTCKRERFYLTEYGGTGIVRATSKTELAFGTDMHEALHELATRLGEPDVVGDIAPRLYNKIYTREGPLMGYERAHELALIGEGAFRAFVKSEWPKILRAYDVVAVEVECLKKLSDWLTFMARPDLILRSKATGEHWYWEYKTTGQQAESFLTQWPKAVQVHSGCVAAEETLGFPVVGCIIQGIAKGYQKDGHYRSVYTEGWRNLLGINVAYAYTYMRTKGWEKFCPAELDGGIAEWVEGMPLDLMEKQFPRSQPIYLRRDLAERFFAQLLSREHDILAGVESLKIATADFEAEEIMDQVFPMTFSQCTGRYGKYDCSYLEACWSGVGGDPLGSGIYVRREPHHQLEVDLYASSSD